jgi:ATP synthase I chain
MGRILGTLLGGGMGATAVAFLMGQKELSLGFFCGSFLSVFNFWSLKRLAAKTLQAGTAGRKTFWLWNLGRWVLFGLACWALIRLSPSCLFGALGTYLWSLLVLGWMGWKKARSKVPLDFGGRP